MNASRLETAYSCLVALVLVTVGVAVFVPEAAYLAGILTLLSGLVGLLLVRRTQRLISIALFSIGCAAFAVALSQGGEFRPDQLLSLNQDLLGMLAAVSLLQLLPRTAAPAVSRLRGRAAVVRTAAAVHLLSSVINISAVNIIGDHLKPAGKPLQPGNAMLLSRSYVAAAFWSPFWAASAAALTYSPAASPIGLMLVGLGVALIALALSMREIFRALGPELPEYRGFALSWPLLRIPLALVVVVLVIHQLWPEVSIPRVVLLAATGMTVLVLLVGAGLSSLKRLVRFASSDFAAIRSEGTLFSSAGVLALGLGALLETVEIDPPFDSFTVPVAWLCIVVMVALAQTGVNPIISIAAIAAIVSPVADLPTMYALAAVLSWGLTGASSPLSGPNIYLHGRYGVSNLRMARRNLPFLALVLALAWPALLICDLLF